MSEPVYLADLYNASQDKTIAIQASKLHRLEDTIKTAIKRLKAGDDGKEVGTWLKEQI